MKHLPTIGIIGAGNMGGALFHQLHTHGLSVLVFNRRLAKSRALAGPRAVRSLAELLRRVDCLIIAIKPQSFKELAEELEGRAAKKFVISIMAAITIKKIQSLLGSRRVVRAMPNLPCRVGAGVTAWTASHGVTKKEKFLTKKIFSATGIEMELNNENLVNKLTTISGCGPAYFFYLTEILEKQLRAFGLPEKQARMIAAMTLQGSAQLLATGKKSAGEWRQAVSSKKGVTLAALSVLERKGLPKIFASAAARALKRTAELSKLV